MTTKQLYPFKKADIVQHQKTGRKGVVMSVGQMGHDITALVRWFDEDAYEHVPVGQLKKSLRGIDGGKDPDT